MADRGQGRPDAVEPPPVAPDLECRDQGPARPRPFRNVSAETAEIGEKFRRERRGGSRVTASDSECSDCFLGALGAPRGRGDPWGALYGRARGRFRS